jgi:hypothetical protein
MGVSIGLRGRLRNPALLSELIDEQSDGAAEHADRVMDWYKRFRDAAGELEHPVPRYVHHTVPVLMVGTRMSSFFRKQHDMFLSVPTRKIVNARRLSHLARLLWLPPGSVYTVLADDLEAIAASFDGK